MSAILSQDSKKLLELLINRIESSRPGNQSLYIGYRRVHEALGLNLEASTWGKSLEIQGMMDLAVWTRV